MFINVHMSSDVVRETSRLEARFQAPALQSEVHRLLVRHGILNFLSREEAVAVLDALSPEVLEPKELKAWQELLVYLKSKNRLAAAQPALIEGAIEDVEVGELSALDALAPLVSIVGADLYERLFPTEQRGVSKVGSVEMVATGAVSESEQVKDLRQLRDEGTFPKGTSRDKVFEKLFAPLARVAEEVSIFDRYLYADVGLNSSYAEHLSWILGRLDEVVRPGATVKLYGARGIEGRLEERVPRDGQEAKWMLQDGLATRFNRIGNLRAHLAPSLRDMHHDRHIRFSSGSAVELPSGFDRLGTPALKENMGFTFRHAQANLNELAGREAQVARQQGVAVTDL